MAAASKSASAATTAWLRRHAAGEKALAGVLDKFFAGQTKRIVAALRALKSPAVADVAGLFDDAAETDLLLAAVSESVIGFIATGAASVLKQAARVKTKKDFGGFDVSLLDDFDFSDELQAAIEDHYNTLAKAEYWKEIQQGTKAYVTQSLESAIKEGLSGRDTAKLINQSLGGFQPLRSKLIARTEVTAAYNAGHDAGYQSLAADGVEIEKEWLAVIDTSTRRSHQNMDGERVAATGNFTVGGVQVPYPGHPRLPARERVRCRCTTAPVFALK